MKKIFNIRLLSIVCLFLSVLIVSSCEKDDETENSSKVELESYGPAGVKHGEKISFIGKNLDKVTSIEFVGASVPQTSFDQQTSELIILIVPKEAERGVVTLKTSEGDVVSKAPIDFEVPFTITSITPIVKPGEQITIKGDLLNWITSIQFAKDTVVTEFVSKSMSEIVVTVPLTAQTGPLVFSGAGTKPESFESATELEVILPTITTISPNPIRPEGNLTITGTNLDLTKGVILSGVSSPVTQFVSKTGTQLVVKIPKETQKGKVILQAYSNVTVESTNELVVVLPGISSFAPEVVEREKNLTITGTNLDLATGIIFKGVEKPVTQFVSRTNNQIVVKVPLAANRGVIAVQAISGVSVESSQAMAIVGDLLPLDPLKYAFYEDDFLNGWQNWGWGATTDAGNSDFVRDGGKSIKSTFTGSWGAVKFANAEITTAGYTELTFAIYGGVGTEGKELAVQPGGASTYKAVIQEGKWVEYKVKLADIGNPAKITDIMMQETGWSGSIYIDHVGLR